MFLKKFFSAVTLLTLSLIFVCPEFVNAQEIDCFSREGTNEEASLIFRMVKLERLGIQVSIPENYRAILRQDSTVQILHPDYFTDIKCYLQTGIGGGGMYAESIRLIKENPSLTLRQQAILASEYNHSNVLKPKIIEYNQYPLSGYIVISDSGFWIDFIGNIIGKKQILNSSLGCDCPVELDDLKTLLSRIQSLN